MGSKGMKHIIRLRLWLLNHTTLTSFERRLLTEVSALGFGVQITYGELAVRAGKPNAYRAVGNALNKNPFPLLIPCHRVVSSKGVGGYKLGTAFKRVLLSYEAVAARILRLLSLFH